MASKHEESTSGSSTDEIDEDMLLHHKSRAESTQSLELETPTLSNTMPSDNTQCPNLDICQVLFPSQATSSSNES